MLPYQTEIYLEVHDAVITGETTAEPFLEDSFDSLDGDVVVDDEVNEVGHLWCVLVHVDESPHDSNWV
jgi:hypothetical protein